VTGRRVLVSAVVVAVLAAGAVVGEVVTRSPAPTVVRAVFASADGVFAGNTVEELGVPIGTVRSVRNVGDAVVVTMAVDHDRPVPADATASLVSPQLLGEPSVELAPGYTGGARLADGGTIPLARTSVPVSTDRLLKDLQSFLSQVDPHATGTLLGNLAADLAGQGAGLHALLGNAAGTLQLLASKGDNLGQLDGTLAQITGTLRSRTAVITSLIQNYDTVSAVLASHGPELGKAVTDLATATAQLSALLTPNLQPIESDVAGIARVGRTVSRNLSSVDQLLSSAVLLFAAAERSYDPAHNWLNLNNQLAPGLTVSDVAGLLRDRLAGVCRRIAAHHASGLTPTQLSTLQTCGNPASGFFDPLLGLFPQIAGALTSGPGGGPSPAALESLLSRGLAMIPGAAGLGATTAPAAAAPTGGTTSPAGTPAAPTGSGPAEAGSTPTLTAPAASQLPPLPPASGGSAPSPPAGVGGLLGGLLGGL
jgi:phospholipid/cholesterol/gamma-HCH transport system substrate-binding protein